nr:formyltransferase family protein [Desulfobacula sp.]
CNLTRIIEERTVELKAIVTHDYVSGAFKMPRPLFKAFVDISEKHGLPLIIVDKNHNNLKILKGMDFDFLVANCYTYFIPSEINALPRIAALNMHRSLLPKYKGLQPLKRALEQNETKTGTTIHKMIPEIDSGEIIDQYEIPIEEGENISALFQKLYPVQYPLMKKALIKLLK